MNVSTAVPATPRIGQEPRRRGELAAAILVAAVVVAGVSLRFATLGLQSFDEDETVTVWLVHHSLPKMLSAMAHTESTPPLYYILAWVWTRAFGFGAVALRSLSALMGAAAIPVCYLAGRALGGRRVALVAAAGAALSPAFVWYSQEARSYALLILLSAASVLFAIRAIDGLRTSRAAVRRDVWLWALVAALALATHYFAVFLVVPEAALVVAAAGSERRHALAATAVVALVGAALLPLALTQHGSGGGSWIQSDPLGGRLADVPPQLLLGEGRPFFRFYTLISGLLLIAPLVLARARRTVVPLAFAACAVVLPIAVDVAGLHVLEDRNMLGVAPPLLVACAFGVAFARPRPLAAAAFVGALGMWLGALVLVLANPLHQREDWRDAARALGAAPQLRAVVMAPPMNNPSPAPAFAPLEAVYLKNVHAMPDAGVTVREIDTLNVRDDLSDTSGPGDPIAPLRGLRLVGRSVHSTFTLYRFVSPVPVHVTPHELIGRDPIDNRDSSELAAGVQRPGPTNRP